MQLITVTVQGMLGTLPPAERDGLLALIGQAAAERERRAYPDDVLGERRCRGCHCGGEYEALDQVNHEHSRMWVKPGWPARLHRRLRRMPAT